MSQEESLRNVVAHLGKKVIDLQSDILAMQIVIRSLLLSHPDREHAIELTNAELLRWEGSGLHTDLPDSTIGGFARIRTRVFPSHEDLQRYP